MGYTGFGPATEPEPVPLSPVGQEQVDYRDAEIAKLRALAYDQYGEAYRDRFDGQMKAAIELLEENKLLRAELDEARRDIAEWVRSDAELQARITAVGEVHWRVITEPGSIASPHYCAADEKDWPCPTVRALTGAERGDSGGE